MTRQTKYRPVLTKQDIESCVSALEQVGHYPITLRTLRLYLFKIDNDAITSLPVSSRAGQSNQSDVPEKTEAELMEELKQFASGSQTTQSTKPAQSSDPWSEL